ncbi:MAG: rRNA pseudouridine synthase [Clostridiales bacterium]|nr:rRNA pseudouridine synthase [Clostridiales bacterium]
MKERLQKLISQAGVCSRRAAEALLAGGCVRVNGEVASLGDKADFAADVIEVDGRVLHPPAEQVYLMLHKPRGYVTTLSDEKGRPTSASLVADCGRRVYPVGRLDMDSEGLLLFTDDGALMQSLIHPKYEINKTYTVNVNGFTDYTIEILSAMCDLEGERICPPQVSVLHRTGQRAELSVTIHEGKNRQVRRMCAAAGLEVTRLCRVAEGGLLLGTLMPGRWRYLTKEEIKSLKGEG